MFSEIHCHRSFVEMGLQDETRATSLACRHFSSPHSATSFVGAPIRAHPLNLMNVAVHISEINQRRSSKIQRTSIAQGDMRSGGNISRSALRSIATNKIYLDFVSAASRSFLFSRPSPLVAPLRPTPLLYRKRDFC